MISIYRIKKIFIKMYSVPKIKRFNTITQQSQKSWRSNLSSNSKRHIMNHNITQSLILIRDDIMSFFENNKEYLFPTDNEEYICLDNSSSIVPPEELLYRLIDILKNDDFISILEEASSFINTLSKQLDDAKNEIMEFSKKKNSESALSSNRTDFHGVISKELLNKIKEKNLINKKLSIEYDNLIDEYLTDLTQKMKYEQKIKSLEENLKNFQNTKLKNEELLDENKQMKDEIFLYKNELSDLKKVNNKLYEDNIKIKDELQRLYKLVEFKNKEYLDLTEKNKKLLKDNYTYTMQLQRNEEKLKLCVNNLKEEKERNKEIIDDLEKQVSEKENEINNMKKKIRSNIISLLEENKNGNFEFILDEINNRLKIIYKGQIICCIPKFNREMPTSFYNRKKYKISSNIHPELNDINSSSKHNYKPMTLSKNKKGCEINNFNITYKLSKNEYEYDSGSSINHSSNSKSHSSFRLDKIYEQVCNSSFSNSGPKSKLNSGVKSNKNTINDEKENKYKKCFSQKIEKYLNKDNEKKTKTVIRRAMTDIRRRFLLNRNKKQLKINSFGLDVESIKEEKDEDNISISNFDFNIKSKNEKDISLNTKKLKEYNSMSNFLETDSLNPINDRKDYTKLFIVNHVDDFSFNRKYLYPNNVKLKVKKVNIKRIIHKNNINETQIKDNKTEECNIF